LVYKLKIMSSLDKVNALVKSAVELQALANQSSMDKQSLLSSQSERDQQKKAAKSLQTSASDILDQLCKLIDFVDDHQTKDKQDILSTLKDSVKQ